METLLIALRIYGFYNEPKYLTQLKEKIMSNGGAGGIEKRETQVPTEMDCLGKAAERLCAAISTLQAKLDPVLMPKSEAPDEKDKPTVNVMAPLANDINKVFRVLNHKTASVEETIGRLEL